MNKLEKELEEKEIEHVGELADKCMASPGTKSLIEEDEIDPCML